MKTVAHMHADLHDMEDGVKGHMGMTLDCAGTGKQYIAMLANMIRVSADKLGLDAKAFAWLVAEAIDSQDEAEMSRIMVDREAIERARGEA